MPDKLVVLVDDDPDVLTSLDRLLRVSGFATEVYSSGEALLASGACLRAACLVLDVQLGGMSGFEVRRRLTARGTHVPIIFMTAFKDEAAQQAAAVPSRTTILRKPFPAKDLIEAIETIAA